MIGLEPFQRWASLPIDRGGVVHQTTNWNWQRVQKKKRREDWIPKQIPLKPSMKHNQVGVDFVWSENSADYCRTAVVALEQSNLDDIRLLQHKDSEGNVISVYLLEVTVWWKANLLSKLILIDRIPHVIEWKDHWIPFDPSMQPPKVLVNAEPSIQDLVCSPCDKERWIIYWHWFDKRLWRGRITVKVEEPVIMVTVRWNGSLFFSINQF